MQYQFRGRLIAAFQAQVGEDKEGDHNKGREHKMPGMNRDKDGKPLRKRGGRSRHGRKPKNRDEEIFFRTTVLTRNRIDNIMDEDGPDCYCDLVENLLELYDYMVGLREEPEWLKAVQAEYQARRPATDAGIVG
jgi:hypothetical protein